MWGGPSLPEVNLEELNDEILSHNLSRLLPNLLAKDTSMDVLLSTTRSLLEDQRGVIFPEHHENLNPQSHPLFSDRQGPFALEFSFLPFFPPRHHQAARLERAKQLVAVIIAYAFRPEKLLSIFLGLKFGPMIVEFRAFRDALELGFVLSRQRRRARLEALVHLFANQRIELANQNEPNEIVTFVDVFLKASKDIRSLLLRHVLTEVEHGDTDDGIERRVVEDTVNIWMRCKVLEKSVEGLLVTYEQWTSKWDEVIPESSARMEPWVNPQKPVVLVPLTPAQLRSGMSQVLKVLRSGFFPYLDHFI